MKEHTERLPILLVAEMLNTTPLNVLMHIKRGLLQAIEEDGLWLVDIQSLDELIAKTGGSKAENICTSDCSQKHACGGGCS
ncbi:MAG: hypothetical protein IH613_08560 [Desulfuromonadales bacterium]|nr:hypothetical protein [Desulfuromonadales bacterium]